MMKKNKLKLSLNKNIISKLESKVIVGNGNNSNNTDCATRGPICTEKTSLCQTMFPGCPPPQTIEAITG